MTQEKMRKVITACVSAATVLLMLLFGYLIYQWRTMWVSDKRIESLEMEIAQLEEILARGEDDLEYYQSEFYLNQKVLELQKLLEKK